MAWCLSRIKGQSILDPYMGSGPVLLAAKRMGRKCVGIEIDESYCEKAARDLEQSVFEFPEAFGDESAESAPGQMTMF